MDGISMLKYVKTWPLAILPMKCIEIFQHQFFVRYFVKFYRFKFFIVVLGNTRAD